MAIRYTEPNARFDLAAIQTAEVREDNGYVSTGEKMFTGELHICSHSWLSARTNPDVAKDRGISVFIWPLHAPGVSVQALWAMAGSRLNIVCLDHMRVHAREMVGEEDQEWYIIAKNLDFERSGIERIMASLLLFEETVQYARETQRNGRPPYEDPVLRGVHRGNRHRLQRGPDVRVSGRVAPEQRQGAERRGSMSKAFGADLGQKTTQLAMQVLGMYGPVQDSERWSRLNSRVAYNYLLTVSDSIRAGTAEIQRNIIATRGLGLPRQG